MILLEQRRIYEVFWLGRGGGGVAGAASHRSGASSRDAKGLQGWTAVESTLGGHPGNLPIDTDAELDGADGFEKVGGIGSEPNAADAPISDGGDACSSRSQTGAHPQDRRS